MGFALRTVASVSIQLILFLIGLLAAWQLFPVGLGHGLSATLLVAAGGIAGLLGAIVVHELGHAFAGLVVRIPINSITLVLLRVEWSDGTTRFRFNRLWFAHAGMVRTELCETKAWRYAVVVAGGPMASLILAVGLMSLAAWTNPGPLLVPPSARHGWREVAILLPGTPWAAWLNLSGLANLYLGIATVVPGTAANVRTDGGQLLDLFRGRFQPSIKPTKQLAG